MRARFIALAALLALASPARAGSPLLIDPPDTTTKDGQAAAILGDAVFVDGNCPLMSSNWTRVEAVLSQYGFELQDFEEGERERMMKQMIAFHRQVSAKIACEKLYDACGPRGGVIPGLINRTK